MLYLKTASYLLRSLFLAMSVLLTCQVHALQLSQPSLQSQLGQPLKLEVLISDLSVQEAQDFQVVLADDKVYQTAKIDRVGGLDNMTLSLIKRGDDGYVLQIAGTEPLLSPYVDVLLEFRWASGRSFRNIGFPLSGTLNNTPSGLVAAESTPSPLSAPSPTAASTPTAQTPKPSTLPQDSAAPAGTPKNTTALPESGKSIEVQRGDTASGLILATETDNVSLDQLLVTMLRNNPKAFVDNNVNRLKSGVLVTLPTPEEARQVDRQEARQSIRLQAQDFDAYRAQLAASAPGTPLANANQREASGGLKAQVNKNGTTAKDQLTLSKPGVTDADNISKQLEEEQTAKRAEELAKNASELDAISKAASKMEATAGLNFSYFEAQYEIAMVWVKRHAFELIGALALLAAALVTFSLVRERRSVAPTPSSDDASEMVYMQDQLHHSAHELNLDFDLDLPQNTNTGDLPPVTPAATPNATSTHQPGNAAPFQVIQPASRTTHTAVNDFANMGEDPFQVRLELADELWKLGQKQTGRALAQEVADQTNGETRERAMRWLTERA